MVRFALPSDPCIEIKLLDACTGRFQTGVANFMIQKKFELRIGRWESSCRVAFNNISFLFSRSEFLIVKKLVLVPREQIGASHLMGALTKIFAKALTIIFKGLNK